MMRTERDQIAAKARKICADPRKADEWRAAWARVSDSLDVIYLARRPHMKVFEVHHAKEVAREAFLRAAVAGTPLAECETLAFNSITKESGQ